jgi:prepilin-type N-terminal cleavage/methylation domain-containing protein
MMYYYLYMAGKYHGNNSGFSLIEIMVAIMILGVVFVGLIGAFPFALNLITEARSRTQAAYLAQAKIEELNQLGYSAVATGTIEVKQHIGPVGSFTYPFQRETKVEYINGNLATSTVDYGLKKISTTVYYTGAAGKTEKSYNLTMIISRRQ